MKSKIALWVAFFGMVCAARGQVTFTITGTATNNGTANSSAFGYTSGQSYKFVFTTSGTIPANSDSYFDPTNNTWVEYASHADAAIFTDVTGSGRTGTFSRPPDSVSEVYAAGSLFQIFFGSESGNSSLGLSTPGSTTTIGTLAAYLTLNQPGHPNFATPGSFTDLTDYFSNYYGDYLMTDAGANTKFTVFNSGNTGSVVFTATELTIGAAVPEPATYAALAGLAALGFVALRRSARVSRRET